MTGRDSPQNPDYRDIDLKDAIAIAFAVLSGAIVGLARILANQQATRIVANGSKKSPKHVADKANG